MTPSYPIRSREWGIGSYPICLNDNRRILFGEGGSLFVLDRLTGERGEILTLKSPTLIGAYMFSRDNRRLYYTSGSNEADVWMLSISGQNRER